MCYFQYFLLCSKETLLHLLQFSTGCTGGFLKQSTILKFEMSKKYYLYKIRTIVKGKVEKENENESCLGTSIIEKRKMEIWILISLKLPFGNCTLWKGSNLALG